MKKIEFLKQVLGATTIESNGCGQCYSFESPRIGRGLVWVDNLPGFRVSIKIKYFEKKEKALGVARELYCNLVQMRNSVVDAATKYDAYRSNSSRFPAGWSARLRCDRHW